MNYNMNTRRGVLCEIQRKHDYHKLVRTQARILSEGKEKRSEELKMSQLEA